MPPEHLAQEETGINRDHRQMNWAPRNNAALGIRANKDYVADPDGVFRPIAIYKCRPATNDQNFRAIIGDWTKWIEQRAMACEKRLRLCLCPG